MFHDSAVSKAQASLRGNKLLRAETQVNTVEAAALAVSVERAGLLLA